MDTGICTPLNFSLSKEGLFYDTLLKLQFYKSVAQLQFLIRIDISKFYCIVVCRMSLFKKAIN